MVAVVEVECCREPAKVAAVVALQASVVWVRRCVKLAATPSEYHVAVVEALVMARIDAGYTAIAKFIKTTYSQVPMHTCVRCCETLRGGGGAADVADGGGG